MGHRALSKVQLGRETTPGTAVAADTIWRGPFAGIVDARTIITIEEDLGIPLKSSRKTSGNLLAELSMPATPATPEQLPHILEAGIKAVGTGAADGAASSGYVYAYPFGLTTLNTVAAYTIESGDEVQAEEMEYSRVKSFVISAVRGEPVQMSAEWFGRQATNVSFTGALSAPDVTEIFSNSGTLYIDEPSGTIGTTQITAGNLIEAVLTVNTGQAALFTADSGQLYFNEAYYNFDELEFTLELKFLHKTAAVTEREKFRANTNRLVRLEFTGADYGTAGSGTLLNGKCGIQIDFPGSYSEFSAVEHEDGLSIVTATLTGGYENESGEGFAIRVANELSTLP